MRLWKYILAIPLIMLALAAILWPIHKSRTFQFFGKIVSRVETTEKVVALTFDDGPAPGKTDEILSILEDLDVKATFFVTGAGGLADHLEEGRKIVAAGHQLGNHTYSHERTLILKPLSTFAKEIEATDALIREAGYEGEIYFRPPYGKKLFTGPWYLSRHGRTTVTWDVEPESYPEVAGSAEAITAHVLEKVRPGSIILLHVMWNPDRASIESVRPIVEGLRAEGYRFVTVSELLAME